ncbi:MAG: class I SAM-dependent rRNA methyltransferase [Bdellovibrionota bacterium]|nr:MAG: class I SAM-dependent rRNA methyltransferase [Bdellovibrionota bacterium]
MTFISPGIETVRLKMRVDRTRHIKQGYPWIYRDWLTETPAAPPGSRALVRDRDGKLLAFGFYDPENPLAVRVCATESEQLDDALIVQRLEASIANRSPLAAGNTTGYRWVNGEGDLLPGLVCDRYDQCAVIKLDGAAPEAFWNSAQLSEWFVTSTPVEGLYQRFRNAERGVGQWLRGRDLSTTVHFTENGIQFVADIAVGQKTGFFFDQRENRDRIRLLAKDRRTLNLFGYTGGFSVYAGKGGASQVTTVDIAKPAIAAARENWRHNGLAPSEHEAIAEDAFEFLSRASEASRVWDLIIVDPPSFAASQKQVERATESYTTLFARAFGCLASQGVIALSSCSSHISMQQFLEIIRSACSKARRRSAVLGVYGQPLDHPFPLLCTELQYLKFVLLQTH